MKLYYHKTDGGAEYLMDKRCKNPDGSWEGVVKGAKYVVRIDGDIRKDAELMVDEPSKDEIAERVEASLARRQANLRATPKSRKQDEAAFLAGACCTLEAVFGNPGSKSATDYIPPAWILAPMCGRTLEDLRKRNGNA